PRKPRGFCAHSAAGLRSLLSALGAPKCREQAVSVRETLWLLPENPPQGWVKVDWRVRLDSGRMLRILTAEKNQSDQLSKSHFSGRAGFQQNNLSLWISAVGTADSGVYRADFEDTSGAVTALCFRVSVWEPVRPPHLEQNVLHREQGWCNLSLVCAVPGAVNISYSWTCSRDPPGALEPQSWVHLQVHNDDNHTICSCNASNPVSWSVVSTDITAACGAKASGLFNIIPWLAVAVFLGLALSVAVAVVCYSKRKQGKASPGGLSLGLTWWLTGWAAMGGTETQVPLVHQPSAGFTILLVCCLTAGSRFAPQSPSLKKKRLDPALVSTAYVEVTSVAPVR
uniref:Natural killer cell receptor 2B4 immunoglobulin domain-containing protein n=1 Tax=Otus sunia TaxID=257818 RepID=A0A8C8EA67_9STRI